MLDVHKDDTLLYRDLPDPLLRYDQITNRFVLIEDLVTPEVLVPKGEYTDGATVPQVISNIVKPFDRHLVPCIVHDYMYRHAIVLPGYEHNPKLGADELFQVNLLRCHKLFGLDLNLVSLMVVAVKEFGRGAYGGKCSYVV